MSNNFSYQIPDYLLQSIRRDFDQNKTVSNIFFDQLYPEQLRRVSSTHWTPVEVAVKAAHFLNYKANCKILDVGSGCGKFCLVGALSQQDCHFTGIEQRDNLTDIASHLAYNLSISNTTFISGNAFDIEWSEFDGFYFYNPFWENHLSAELRIDQTVTIGQEIFEEYIRIVTNRLENLKKGTHIVTYHGHGGRFPPTYECVSFQTCGTGQLKVWVKIK